MKYHECTDVDDVKPWCFTDLRKGEWGYCQKSCLGCQTEDGDECVFPFTYQDTKYNECTSVDDVKPWCFTDLRSGEWGYCMGSCSTTSSTPARKTKPTHSSCQTENGDACVFPFTYQGTLYHECTSVVAGKPWCFTDGGGWGYCQESCSTTNQPSGSLQGPQVGPTKANSPRNVATNQPSGNPQGPLVGPSFSLQPSSGNPRVGPARANSQSNVAKCQTEDGDACVFPFTYQGIIYNECTYVDADKPWCITDIGWGYCQESCSTTNQPSGNLQVKPRQPGD